MAEEVIAVAELLAKSAPAFYDIIKAHLIAQKGKLDYSELNFLASGMLYERISNFSDCLTRLQNQMDIHDETSQEYRAMVDSQLKLLVGRSRKQKTK
jgi:hypothetical protein